MEQETSWLKLILDGGILAVLVLVLFGIWYIGVHVLPAETTKISNLFMTMLDRHDKWRNEDSEACEKRMNTILEEIRRVRGD